MIAITCHAEFCTLNPVQVLLDGPDGAPMLFETIQDADDFLANAGFDSETINDGFNYVDAEPSDTVDAIVDRFWQTLSA